MVDPETNALLVLYDDAQNIYEQRQQRRLNFKSLGIQAQGRTTILKLNYRNTQEVLAIAYEFAKEMLTPTGEPDEDTLILVQPQSAGRHGPKPQLIRFPSFCQEVTYLVDRVRQMHADRGIPWNHMAILYRARFMGEQIYQHFQQQLISVEWISKDKDSQLYDPAAPSIKLVTMHSSKGLEFPVVLIPGLGFIPSQKVPIEDEARLLYVAMTHAIDELVLTGDRASAFLKRLESMLG